ncbi:hypothetical protein [Micromonospora narathiwatensis]|uniref:DNA-directed RNA polymerase specialized sigma subunit, sigma24 family n=1 Tax=Micromonospora narathiwatensis TaxID=299146 RepID=A0A1A9ADW8_9ACTN|nr:hypothetical protein [Micromonospora narathiwatensis]SBT54301.1 hypothetical protein GA0070621_5321 [Micromonospora narathiwatensis]
MSANTRPVAGPLAGHPGSRPGAALLGAIDYRFRLCGEGPQPQAVDGRQLGHGLPRRRIALTELSAILMHPSCGAAAQDAAWRLLVVRARTGEDRWVVGAIGVALPGLRHRAHLLSKLSSGDLHAALVEAFLKALNTVELDQPGIVNALLNAAFSGARAALRGQEPAESGEADFAPGSALPPAPYGHPDLVLARAVRIGAISVAEADLIGGTFLEDTSLAAYAERTGLPRWGVYKRRSAAVQRLVAAIRSGALSDPTADVIAEATGTTAPAATPRRP